MIFTCNYITVAILPSIRPYVARHSFCYEIGRQRYCSQRKWDLGVWPALQVGTLPKLYP